MMPRGALRRVAAAELGPDPRALVLVARFLETPSYARPFALELLDVARSSGAPWELRRVAALMLQSQVLRLSPRALAEFGLLCDRLGLCEAGAERVRDSVLAEGFTTTEPRAFARQLHARLSRARGVLAPLWEGKATPAALRDFFAYARRECRLDLARYLFTPEEVVERILSQVRSSRGAPHPFPEKHPYIREEARRAFAGLPAYEAEILQRLGQGHRILWVSERTSSEIDSLVEYPLTTVVLVIKPPGSDVEIEIKRAGCRGDRLLGVVYERGGEEVPPSHRLAGGSMGGGLKYEARSSSFLARLYRAAHGAEAPLSRSIAVRSIYGVPVDGREEHICDYFTHAWAFGEGFPVARGALQESVEAFVEEANGPPDLPGDLGETMRFLYCVTPAQGLLVQTSSFRLDKVALYLSAEGPDRYFRQGLGREPGPGEAKRFADELLEEILGLYTPPGVPYRSSQQYVKAAIALPVNRARADRVYLDLMRQIGAFWGTLYAAGGCTWGESFVARNVGLRSCWEDGRWRVRVLFMDHDRMRVGRDHLFQPHKVLYGMWEDQRYILGDGLGQGSSGKGEVGFLGEIYRVAPGVVRAGRLALRAAARSSYRKTLPVMAGHPEVRPLFRRSFLRESVHWDEVMRTLPFLRRAGGDVKEALRPFLVRRDYEPARIDPYLETVAEHSAFLESQRFFHHPG
ncbi:MAG TPA: hypothetical protein VKM72_07860 [Thermoanaerobaculia bacterium]|nr:hypothetical protein [Thermoanaerobaculia bacterium]